MNKFLTWVTTHIRSSVAIVVFSAATITCGSIVLSSYVNYSKYEKEFYVNELNTKADSPAVPNAVYIDDSFSVCSNDALLLTKSNYPKSKIVYAKDMKVSPNSGTKTYLINDDSLLNQYIGGLEEVGGTVSFNLNFSMTTYADIEFVIGSSIVKDEKYYKEMADLFDNISIKINGTEIAGDIVLKSDKSGINWHHLVLESVAIKNGETKVEITSGNRKVFPFVKNVTVYSNADVNIA